MTNVVAASSKETDQPLVRHIRAIVVDYDPAIKLGHIETATERFAFDQKSARHIAHDLRHGDRVVAEVSVDNCVTDMQLAILS
jgi:hypothetical protein